MCLSLWKPLTIAKEAVASGAAHLGVVTQPDGRRQVTYRGGPLYTFVQDKRPGDVKGNGFKDVGIWRVAIVSGSSTSAPPPATTSGGYGGGYGP